MMKTRTNDNVNNNFYYLTLGNSCGWNSSNFEYPCPTIRFVPDGLIMSYRMGGKPQSWINKDGEIVRSLVNLKSIHKLPLDYLSTEARRDVNFDNIKCENNKLG